MRPSRQEVRPAVLGVCVFTGAYMLAAVVGAFVEYNQEFLYYIGFLAFLVALIAWLHRLMDFSPALLWLLSIVGGMHMLGGLVAPPEAWPIARQPRVFYNLYLIEPYLKYDQLVHFFGYGVAVWPAWRMMQVTIAWEAHKQSDHVPATLVRLVLCALAAAGVGAFNEILEFGAKRIVGHTNVGGYENTLYDLIYNMAGALVAALIIWLLGRRPLERVHRLQTEEP